MEHVQVPGGSVVVGVDGSEASERAVRWAAALAGLEHRPVVLVHAPSPPGVTAWMGVPGFNPAMLIEAKDDSARSHLQEAAAAVHALDPRLTVYRVLEHRDARDALLSMSKSAAVLVVGSRGRGPMACLILGSVSLAVSQHSSCPVVVVRRDASESGGGIVVGTDGTARSDAAVGFAFRQASLRSLPLTVVHAFWSDQDDGYPTRARAYEAADLEDMRLLLGESIAGPKADHPDVKVTLHVERGVPDSVLLHACETADLVVVGTHPTNAVYDLLSGEVSRSVLGHARCPVAVVPDSV
jgi:nucleotide-binding universal stress UspA family protein